MYRPRIIPVLLLKNKGLVKTKCFKKPRYIGDPINAVKIFNDLKADELVFLDILASKENRTISLDFIKKVGEEANMPFSVGGGIKSIEEIRKIIEAGAEKVILNSIVMSNSDFLNKAVEEFGSSTVVVCIDHKRNIFGKSKLFTNSKIKTPNFTPLEFAKLVESKGAGEIIIQSVDKDGCMEGYDVNTIKEISENISIPVTALGGAGKLLDMTELMRCTVVNGLAAGSLFVYHGPRRAVLVNYPTKQEIISLTTNLH